MDKVRKTSGSQFTNSLDKKSVSFLISSLVLLMSQFSWAGNDFEIMTWHSSLTLTPFSFLGLKLSISKFSIVRLLTDSISLTCVTTRLWSVLHSAPLTDRPSCRIGRYHLSIKMWTISLFVPPHHVKKIEIYTIKKTREVSEDQHAYLKYE